MKNFLSRLCARIKGAEHAIAGGSMVVAGSVTSLWDKLQKDDLLVVLQKFWPTNWGWTAPQVLTTAGVVIVILHFIIGNHAKRDGDGGQ